MTEGVPLKGDSHCPGVWSEGISIPGVISIEPGAPVSPAGLYLSVPVHFLLAVTAGLSPEVLPQRGEGAGRWGIQNVALPRQNATPTVHRKVGSRLRDPPAAPPAQPLSTPSRPGQGWAAGSWA